MKTPTVLYRAMRKTWPHLPRTVRRRLGRRGESRPVPGSVEPVGILSTTDLDAIAARVERDGFAVLDQRLPAPTCDALLSFATSTPARSAAGERAVVTGKEDLSAPRYDFDERDLLRDPTVQRLVLEPSWRALAARYLGGEAVSDMAAMWWSIAQPGSASESAAQLFHTDRDRLSFVKFFVYLTDVDPSRGPHVYVRGSHRRLPHGLRSDRRYRDDEVVAVCGDDALTELTGPRGTILVADTSGLHKGLPPQVGHRLVFQVEFTTCLFGAPYFRFPPAILDPTCLSVARARPRAYQRLLAA